MATGGSKRKKPDIDGSPDKSEQMLSKALDVCGKCNKKCTARGEFIQCDLCGNWAHANCENIMHDQYKTIKTLSSLYNLVYYCNTHDCNSRIKNIVSEWIQTRHSSQIEEVVVDLTKQYLSSEHGALQKAVSDLSSRIDKLQAQELELSSQIKTTSKALVTHTDRSKSQNVSRKSNVVVYGVEECSPKTPKSVRLQSDSNAVSKVFSSTDVHIEPNQVVDCFWLGKFKSNQSRSRPILVKLQCTIDATTILANRTSLSSPIFIKPDMSPAEQKIESILLKERWLLIEGGFDHKSIKISSVNHSIYVNNQVFGRVVNSQFQRTNNYHPNPPPPANHMDDTTLAASSQPSESHDHEPSFTSSSVAENNSNGLATFYYINARSIVNKLQQFQSLVYTNSYDFIGITETWLSNKIYNNEILPSGYVVFCKDCLTRGGGVMLAVRSGIPCQLIDSPSELEIVYVLS